MLGVAVLALGFFLFRGLCDIVENALYGSSSEGILSPGGLVITVGEYRVGKDVLPSGTPGVVETDGAVDLDDCKNWRTIVIKLLSGAKQGNRVEIPRGLLRTQNR